MNTNDSELELKTQRDRLYAWLKSCVVGEKSIKKLHGIRPLDRFHSAILFPILSGEFGIDPGSENEFDEPEEDVSEEESTQAQSVKQRRYIPPSSVGFSFFVTGEEVKFQLIAKGKHFVLSEKRRDERQQFLPDAWFANLLGGDSEALMLRAPRTRKVGQERFPVFSAGNEEPRAEVFVLWRPLGEGWLVTVSLSNTQKCQDKPAGGIGEAQAGREASRERNLLALFDVQLQCVIEEGQVGQYPKAQFSNLSEEEQELDLRYRHNDVYAVGHGAAAEWDISDGRVNEIRTDFLPKVEVPQVSTEAPGVNGETLSLLWLSGIEENRRNVCAGLDRFIACYVGWVDQVAEKCDALTGEEHLAANRIRSRMAVAIERMRLGVNLLSKDVLSVRAFSLANQAMLNQMIKSDEVKRKGLGDKRSYRWRPFQLAFLLLTVESVANEDSEFRDTLDLIWFPTGGGKTEAYLGLMAFLICWRRLKFGDSGGGTSVLMRYTLRLLTKDQFRRATRLICALELLRRANPDIGHEPITIGLWVGAASSPNTFYQAHESLIQARETDSSPPKFAGARCLPMVWSCVRCTHKLHGKQGSFLVSLQEFRL